MAYNEKFSYPLNKHDSIQPGIKNKIFELNKKWKHPISKIDIKRLILSLPNRDITSIKQI